MPAGSSDNTLNMIKTSHHTSRIMDETKGGMKTSRDKRKVENLPQAWQTAGPSSPTCRR
ncbi:hypothetical protein Mapa_012306 [Marchantia paleacea]|nr:hypothetical protein Mapa_012306 [Marchantia paleacea]